MRQDRFTIKAQEAVAAAQQAATGSGNPEATPLHLLFALLNQPDSFPVPILQRLGVDLDNLRRRVQEAIAGLPSVSGTQPAEPRPSQGLVAALQAAEREAAAQGRQTISTEHLLLALTQDAQVRELLPDRESLLKAIDEVVGPNVAPDSLNPEETAQALEKFGRDLTAEAEAGKLDPVIGRDEEIRRVIQVLARRTKNNPVLIG